MISSVYQFFQVKPPSPYLQNCCAMAFSGKLVPLVIGSQASIDVLLVARMQSRRFLSFRATLFHFPTFRSSVQGRVLHSRAWPAFQPFVLYPVASGYSTLFASLSHLHCDIAVPRSLGEATRKRSLNPSCLNHLRGIPSLEYLYFVFYSNTVVNSELPIQLLL